MSEGGGDRSNKKRYVALLVALLLLLLLFVGLFLPPFVKPPGPAPPPTSTTSTSSGSTDGPTLVLSTYSAPSGSTVTLTGSGFTPGHEYAVCINTFQGCQVGSYSPPFYQTQLATFTADSSGGLPSGVTIVIPSEEPNGPATYGTYYINAWDTVSNANILSPAASDPLTVTPSTLLLAPSSGPSGYVIGVSGSGYAPSQSYELCFNSFPGATSCAAPPGQAAFGIFPLPKGVVSSSSGGISANFAFPSSPAGNYSIGVYFPSYSDNYYMTNDTFVANMTTLAALPSSAPPGSDVLVTGRFYAPSQTDYFVCIATVGATAGGQCYPTPVTTDVYGNLSVCIKTPTTGEFSAPGNYEIGVYYRESYSNYWPFMNITSFTVTSGAPTNACSPGGGGASTSTSSTSTTSTSSTSTTSTTTTTSLTTSSSSTESTRSSTTTGTTDFPPASVPEFPLSLGVVVVFGFLALVALELGMKGRPRRS